jgi:hypothetical protein
VHLVGFIIRVFHDARSSECQKKKKKISKVGREDPQILDVIIQNYVIMEACIYSFLDQIIIGLLHYLIPFCFVTNSLLDRLCIKCVGV